MMKFFLDLHIVLIVLVVSLLSYIGLFPIDKQGFYCNDETIRYDYRGDTIRMWVLLAVTIAVPVLVIMFVEYWRHCVTAEDNYLLPTVSTIDPKTSSSDNKRSLVDRAAWMASYFRCCAGVYGTYFYGMVCLFALVEFLKIAVGELRPHFLDTCKPDFSRINCSNKYITEYTCMGEAPVYRLMDAYKSFPSGHAAGSVFMSLFLCFYVHKQVFPHPTYLSSSMLQAGFIFWAIYCSMSRIVDRRHHWWDVIAGFLIGIVIACYSALTWLRTSPPICRLSSPSPSDTLLKRARQARRMTTSLPDYGSCDNAGVKFVIGQLNSASPDSSITIAQQQPPVRFDGLRTVSNNLNN